MAQSGFEHSPYRALVFAQLEDVGRDVVERRVGKLVHGGFHLVVRVVLRADFLSPLFRIFIEERQVVFFDRTGDCLAGESYNFV